MGLFLGGGGRGQNSPMIHFDTAVNLKIAYINCGGEGWKGPGGRVKF